MTPLRPEAAEALRAEADAIAAEFTASEAAMAAPLGRRCRSRGPGPDAAAPRRARLARAGQLGAGLAALGRLRDAGRELRVFVTEGRPFMDGARLAPGSCARPGAEQPHARCRRRLALRARGHRRRPHPRRVESRRTVPPGALVGAEGLAQLARHRRGRIASSSWRSARGRDRPGHGRWRRHPHRAATGSRAGDLSGRCPRARLATRSCPPRTSCPPRSSTCGQRHRPAEPGRPDGQPDPRRRGRRERHPRGPQHARPTGCSTGSWSRTASSPPTPSPTPTMPSSGAPASASPSMTASRWPWSWSIAASRRSRLRHG